MTDLERGRTTLCARTRAPDGAALIELFSSSPAIQCLTPRPILTDSKSNAPGAILIGYEPHTTSSDVSLISAIDASTQTLLTTWIIYSTAEMPNVTKQFEIRIPIEHEDNVITKQLSISNRYSIPRSFRINISKPQLVQVNPTELKNLQPGISVPISLYFPNVVRKPMSVEVLLYILHMDTGTEEETFSMLLTYF
ncbi:hypothetical protein WR25_13136 [Diploscapter pachys]|uniref:NPHP4 Ig-like domain-containing protein n=1 Tax=Diploscapter pachys TaxID=2018661 RepID=A0A2A2LQ19_9BILA|nr:hypothetical protein WR25_13136 [Diploscapter pachys]